VASGINYVSSMCKVCQNKRLMDVTRRAYVRHNIYITVVNVIVINIIILHLLYYLDFTKLNNVLYVCIIL
jgi:hypothetical protein